MNLIRKWGAVITLIIMLMLFVFALTYERTNLVTKEVSLPEQETVAYVWFNDSVDGK